MARLDDFLDDSRVPKHVSGVGGGKENLLDRVAIGKVAAGSIGHQDCISRNFRLSKGLHPFAERANNRKRKALDLDGLSDGSILGAIDSLGELLRNGCHVGA